VAYKVVSEMIINRIKPILEKVLAPTQASFVSGRQIMDSITIAQETLHVMRCEQGRVGFMTLKIDLQEAYNPSVALYLGNPYGPKTP